MADGNEKKAVLKTIERLDASTAETIALLSHLADAHTGVDGVIAAFDRRNAPFLNAQETFPEFYAIPNIHVGDHDTPADGDVIADDMDDIRKAAAERLVVLLNEAFLAKLKLAAGLTDANLHACCANGPNGPARTTIEQDVFNTEPLVTLYAALPQARKDAPIGEAQLKAAKAQVAQRLKTGTFAQVDYTDARFTPEVMKRIVAEANKPLKDCTDFGVLEDAVDVAVDEDRKNLMDVAPDTMGIPTQCIEGIQKEAASRLEADILDALEDEDYTPEMLKAIMEADGTLYSSRALFQTLADEDNIALFHAISKTHPLSDAIKAKATACYVEEKLKQISEVDAPDRVKDNAKYLEALRCFAQAEDRQALAGKALEPFMTDEERDLYVALPDTEVEPDEFLQLQGEAALAVVYLEIAQTEDIRALAALSDINQIHNGEADDLEQALGPLGYAQALNLGAACSKFYDEDCVPVRQAAQARAKELVLQAVKKIKPVLGDVDKTPERVIEALLEIANHSDEASGTDLVGDRQALLVRLGLDEELVQALGEGDNVEANINEIGEALFLCACDMAIEAKLKAQPNDAHLLALMNADTADDTFRGAFLGSQANFPTLYPHRAGASAKHADTQAKCEALKRMVATKLLKKNYSHWIQYAMDKGARPATLSRHLFVLEHKKQKYEYDERCEQWKKDNATGVRGIGPDPSLAGEPVLGDVEILGMRLADFNAVFDDDATRDVLFQDLRAHDREVQAERQTGLSESMRHLGVGFEREDLFPGMAAQHKFENSQLADIGTSTDRVAELLYRRRQTLGVLGKKESALDDEYMVKAAQVSHCLFGDERYREAIYHMHQDSTPLHERQQTDKVFGLLGDLLPPKSAAPPEITRDITNITQAVLAADSLIRGLADKMQPKPTKRECMYAARNIVMQTLSKRLYGTAEYADYLAARFPLSDTGPADPSRGRRTAFSDAVQPFCERGMGAPRPTARRVTGTQKLEAGERYLSSKKVSRKLFVVHNLEADPLKDIAHRPDINSGHIRRVAALKAAVRYLNSPPKSTHWTGDTGDKIKEQIEAADDVLEAELEDIESIGKTGNPKWGEYDTDQIDRLRENIIATTEAYEALLKSGQVSPKEIKKVEAELRSVGTILRDLGEQRQRIELLLTEMRGLDPRSPKIQKEYDKLKIALRSNDEKHVMFHNCYVDQSKLLFQLKGHRSGGVLSAEGRCVQVCSSTEELNAIKGKVKRGEVQAGLLLAGAPGAEKQIVKDLKSNAQFVVEDLVYKRHAFPDAPGGQAHCYLEQAQYDNYRRDQQLYDQQLQGVHGDASQIRAQPQPVHFATPTLTGAEDPNFAYNPKCVIDRQGNRAIYGLEGCYAKHEAGTTQAVGPDYKKVKMDPKALNTMAMDNVTQYLKQRGMPSKENPFHISGSNINAKQAAFKAIFFLCGNDYATYKDHIHVQGVPHSEVQQWEQECVTNRTANGSPYVDHVQAPDHAFAQKCQEPVQHLITTSKSSAFQDKFTKSVSEADRVDAPPENIDDKDVGLSM